MEQNKPRLNLQMLNMTADQLQEVNAQEAQVVSRQLMSRIREITMTIRPDGIQFNNTCIAVFENVVYVHFLVDIEKKLLFVRPAEEFDKDSQRWCIAKDGKRKSRKITGKECADRIYKMMGWIKGYYYRVYGAPAVQIGTEDDYLMVFELKEAEPNILTEKARHAAGVEDAELGGHFEQIQAEAVQAATRKKKRKKQEIYGGNEFGVHLKEHVNRVIVPVLDQLDLVSLIDQE